MTTHALQHYLPDSCRLVSGCMHLGGEWDNSAITQQHISQASELIDVCTEVGVKIFDHADIYTLGKAEQVFGEVFKRHPSRRQELYLQSKCGIRFDDDSGPKRYDFSAQWVEQSVEGSLQRLHTDYLDILILHRPDPLTDRDELARALQDLVKHGKVRHIGVSNMHWHQISYLQEALDLPIIVNQLELSLGHLDWLDEGVTAGNRQGVDINFTAGTLEYCQSHGIQLQSWGSLCQGKFSGKDTSNEPETVKQTAKLVSHLADEYKVSADAIVLSWLLRHPANIQPVLGSTRPDRIKACVKALDITLSREHWYQLYVTARGARLP
ncbi:aldo/keto reductase [Aestuariibacter salexigens]|uniref:aldo/keto reductase n=1 Tax=Aestuariibacter salexigens TaxID=226010 RepID=UPI000479F69E